MPLTILDPGTALVLIDLQAGLAAMPTAHPFEGVVAQAASLADAFRRHDLPVVLVNVAGGAPGRTEQARPGRTFAPGWMEFVPELNRQPWDHVVTKRTWGAFTGTDLDGYLRARRITQLVLAGVATSVGVESTARHAYELDFNVTLAVDAMTDSRLAAHDNSVAGIFPRLGETGTAREVIALLERSRNAATV